ncbi:MAG: hypothetical protein K6T78_14550 [Alicyclobacillus sp.]|nr:hypothetical protein [Alicyclobacillus sp.]
MSKARAAVAAGVVSVVVGVLSTPAFAATSPANAKNIELNGLSVNKPAGLVRSGTTYMPIFYLNQVLNKLGITLAAKWDGHTWALQTPTYMQPNLGNVHIGTGNVTITLNGTPLQKVDAIVAVDPASGVQTTYLPIWYLEQVLSRVGVTDTWDGTTWDLQTSLNYVGKPYDAVIQYADALSTNLNANSDPNAPLETLFHEGYITSGFLAASEQYNQSNPWSAVVQQNDIRKLQLTLFHANLSDMQATTSEIDIPTTEVDTISYTNGDLRYISADNDWTLVPSAQGIWQVDNVSSLDGSASGGGSASGSSGTATGNSGTSSPSGDGAASGATGTSTDNGTSAGSGAASGTQQTTGNQTTGTSPVNLTY